MAPSKLVVEMAQPAGVQLAPITSNAKAAAIEVRSIAGQASAGRSIPGGSLTAAERAVCVPLTTPVLAFEATRQHDLGTAVRACRTRRSG